MFQEAPLALTFPSWTTYYGATEAAALTWLQALPGDPFDLVGEAGPTIPEPQRSALERGILDLQAATGRFFVVAAGTLDLRGCGEDMLQIDPPIIALTKVEISDTELVLADLDVNDGWQIESDGTDPRDDPFVRFPHPSSGAVYLQGWAYGEWPREEQGQIVRLTGSFGYVEPDLSTPILVRYLAALLGVRSYEAPIGDDLGAGDLMRGAIIMEQTRGRSYQLAQGLLSSGVFINLEIDRMIAKYKRPPRVYVSRSRRRGRRHRSY